jgi:hypothetical protein
MWNEPAVFAVGVLQGAVAALILSRLIDWLVTR